MALNYKFRSLKLGTGARAYEFCADVGLGTSDTKIPTQKAVKAYVDAVSSGIANIANGKILIGDAQGVGQEKTVTGDVTITNEGVTAIGEGKVVTAMIAEEDVETSKIAPLAVTQAKLDPDAGKIAKVGVVGGAENAFAFSWQNPHAVPIIVYKTLFKPINVGLTENATMDVGAAPDATTSADNMMSNISLTTPDLKTSTCDKAVVVSENGGALAFINGQIQTANAAELTGWMYIFYVEA